MHAEDPIMIREIDIEEKPLKKDMLYFACSECCNVSKMYQINHGKIVEIMDGIQYDCGAYDDGVRREVQIWTKERRWHISINHLTLMIEIRWKNKGGIYHLVENIPMLYELEDAVRYVRFFEEHGIVEDGFSRYIPELLALVKKKKINWKNAVDRQEFCIQTKIAFWKVKREGFTKGDEKYVLLHAPYEDQEYEEGLIPTIDMALKAKYHIQYDVQAGMSPVGLIRYACAHDDARIKSGGDYRKLPHTTSTQKKYYNIAREREKRESVEEVWKLLDKLTKEANQRNKD